MGGLQVPADRFTRGLTARWALTVATLVAALGFVVMASPTGFAGLCVGLLLAGTGSSLQHPRGSHLVTESYGVGESREALGIYNFSGDIGKAILPAIAALLLAVWPWRTVVGLMGLLGLLVAAGLLALVPKESARVPIERDHGGTGEAGRGFGILLAIGILDTATRMGYLLFLPFIIQARGGSSKTVGFALALLFMGGAFGKASCGWLGRRAGVVASVIATEVATAALIGVTCVTPLTPMLAVLPFLGIVLNGTSSVLYGTVPELAPRGNTGRAFALFYTGVIGSGALAPIVYGAIGDHSSRTIGILSAAGTALVIVPLVLSLRSAFAGSTRKPAEA